GDGTAGSPLQVAAPLVLAGAEVDGIVRGSYGGNFTGVLGHVVGGVYGLDNNSGAWGSLGGGFGARGIYGDNYGLIASTDYGVYGRYGSGSLTRGYLGRSEYAVYGNNSGNEGYIAGNDFAVYGEHSSGNWGALGTSHFGGVFSGDVIVFGTLSKSGGSFKIDHPLDPANKYLSHSFVESPDMMNVYNGNVTTDAQGEAVVTLPDYFEVLNRDFRYQLTVIGQFAQAIIAEEIQGNQFVIRTDQPQVKVSWQVTGIRQDAWAEEHRIVVEEDKPAKERGYYLHPKLYGQSVERSLMWAQYPEAMRTLREMPARLEAEDQRMAVEQARIEAEVARMSTRQD
ncbi:MAG TPA: hypothetical protein VKP65_09305, partial [Rhodothermales bacterium]|nr:hypothetical protein [Rhodothermales bacterium]